MRARWHFMDEKAGAELTAGAIKLTCGVACYCKSVSTPFPTFPALPSDNKNNALDCATMNL